MKTFYTFLLSSVITFFCIQTKANTFPVMPVTEGLTQYAWGSGKFGFWQSPDSASQQICGQVKEKYFPNSTSMELYKFDLNVDGESYDYGCKFFTPHNGQIYTSHWEGIIGKRICYCGTVLTNPNNLGHCSPSPSVQRDPATGTTMIYGYANTQSDEHCPIIATDKKECPGSDTNDGNPISCATGIKTQIESDYQSGGPYPLNYSRTYKSHELEVSYDNGSNDVFRSYLPSGQTQNSINKSKTVEYIYQNSPYFMVRVTLSPNESYVFTSEDDEATYQGQEYAGNLTKTGPSTWEYSAKSGLKTYSINNLGHEYAIQENNSPALTTQVERNGSISTITNPLGRSFQLWFASQYSNIVTSLYDPAGNKYRYEYDSNNRLYRVYFPDQTPNTDADNPYKEYLYENTDFPNAFTGIIDEEGHKFATWKYDENGKAYYSSHNGKAEEVQFDFLSDNNSSGQTEVSYLINESLNQTRKVIKSWEYRRGRPQITQIDQLECENSNCITSSTETRTYDENGYLDTKTNHRGFTTDYTYNALGQLEQKTEALGTPQEFTINYQYHPELNQVTLEEWPEKTIENVYFGINHSTPGKLNKRIESDLITGLVSETTYEYFPENLLTKSVDGPRLDVQDVTQYTYYPNGDLQTETNALGHVTYYDSYDPHGRATSVTDPNGVTTLFEYHPRGWLTKTTLVNPNGADLVTQYDYYADGELERITRPDGSTLTFEYNGANHLIGIENQLGERIDYQVDNAGNQTQQTITSASGSIVFVLQTAYDELSRVMDVLGNNGQQDSTDYDANSNPTLNSNARGAQTQTVYDALDRVTKIIDPDQEETQFTYDAQGNIETVTDARGLVTTYDYDAFGNLRSVDSPDTGLTTYDYDNAGNRIQSIDARGVETQYVYDALNRLTDVIYPSDSSLNVHYEYDQGLYGIGRMSSLQDSTGTTQYQYDFLGRVVQKSLLLNGVALTLEYSYNGDQLAAITYPSGRIVNYYYDSLGRISDVDTQADASAPLQPLVMGTEYKPFGPAKGWMLGNGLQHSMDYDLDYSLTHIRLHAGQNLFHRLYDYDTANNITLMDDQLNAGKTQNFNYDLQNRLTSASGVYGDITYQYDEVGNRTERSVTEGGQSLLETYDYDTLSNRLLGVVTGDPANPSTTKSFIYDDVGNVIQQITAAELKEFNYNAANRMASVERDSDLAGTFLYNALGQRVAADYGDHSEFFVYDESGQLLAIVDDQGNTLREYIYAGNEKVAVVVYSNPSATANTLPLNTHVAYTGQDDSSSGSVTVSADGKSITLLGNRWRATAETYTVSANTYLSFDFESDGLGEIQGVAVDETPNTLSSNRIFHLTGSQSYGIQDYQYTGGTQHFEIPVGQYFTGSGMAIGFVNDSDANPNASTITVRNVRLCEGPCGGNNFVDVSTHQPYTGQTGNGSISVSADGTSITLDGNRWRATTQTVNITANSVLAFDFSSDNLGEIHGIAVDENPSTLSSNRLFQLAGSQTYGIQDYQYTGGTQHFEIPVGQYFTGSNMVIGFVNDSDANPSQGSVTFSNIQVCEGSCSSGSGQGSGSGSTSPELYFVHNDHLNTPQMLTDLNQNVVWSVDYTPFGVVVSGDENFETSRFPGQYFDVATGVSYNYFRDYDPSLGRYVQSDPLGLIDGPNTFVYVANNPIDTVDPRGLFRDFRCPKGLSIDRIMGSGHCKKYPNTEVGLEEYSKDLYEEQKDKICQTGYCDKVQRKCNENALRIGLSTGSLMACIKLYHECQNAANNCKDGIDDCIGVENTPEGSGDPNTPQNCEFVDDKDFWGNDVVKIECS